MSKASGGGVLSGTLTGTIGTSATSVTISTPVYSKADTMTLTATATAGETGLTAVTSRKHRILCGCGNEVGLHDGADHRDGGDGL